MFYSLQGDQKVPLSESENLRLVKWRISTFWVCLVGYVGYYIWLFKYSIGINRLSIRDGLRGWQVY